MDTRRYVTQTACCGARGVRERGAHHDGWHESSELAPLLGLPFPAALLPDAPGVMADDGVALAGVPRFGLAGMRCRLVVIKLGLVLTL
jgi:hypothetical protein